MFIYLKYLHCRIPRTPFPPPPTRQTATSQRTKKDIWKLFFRIAFHIFVNIRTGYTFTIYMCHMLLPAIRDLFEVYSRVPKQVSIPTGKRIISSPVEKTQLLHWIIFLTPFLFHSKVFDHKGFFCFATFRKRLGKWREGAQKIYFLTGMYLVRLRALWWGKRLFSFLFRRYLDVAAAK